MNGVLLSSRAKHLPRSRADSVILSLYNFTQYDLIVNEVVSLPLCRDDEVVVSKVDKENC